MPALVMFLLGVITDSATGLGDKVKAAAQLVGLGHESLIPEPIRQHLPGHADVPRPAVTRAISSASEPAVDGGAGSGWVWLVLVVVVLLALYFRPAVTARLSRASRSSTGSNPTGTGAGDA